MLKPKFPGCNAPRVLPPIDLLSISWNYDFPSSLRLTLLLMFLKLLTVHASERRPYLQIKVPPLQKLITPLLPMRFPAFSLLIVVLIGTIIPSYAILIIMVSIMTYHTVLCTSFNPYSHTRRSNAPYPL